jgi:hypothetical protein
VPALLNRPMAGDLTGQARNVAKVTTLAKRGFEQEDLRPSQGHGLPEPQQRALAMDATTLQAGCSCGLRQDRQSDAVALAPWSAAAELGAGRVRLRARDQPMPTPPE